MIAGEDVFYAVQSKYGEQSTGLTESMQYDTSRRLNELGATANANRVTFYTIDAAGLRVYSSISAENATAGQGNAVVSGRKLLPKTAFLPRHRAWQASCSFWARRVRAQVAARRDAHGAVGGRLNVSRMSQSSRDDRIGERMEQ